ncbi:dethiobiotin synthase [Nocardioides gansuensis]|uniref:ATP-dependent dethiobiotin synthetase BioD n=1 Tax=Nocardioides gansuensis TaxID=2138300 RepID=A0A2T8F6U5_9ACTN|nr:dethiobiotin synthase [Nocardioides gansuensis]PVG81438.1 dethiobiotin synthase [Nocardioides gansuensis]
MSRLVVVTGTDTGVGKTVATALLALRARDAGDDVVVVKPVQTGIDPTVAGDPADVDVVARLAGCPVVEHTRLVEPLAPETAARRAGALIPTVADHASRIRELAERGGTVVVEGAGGALVRLDLEGGTLLDLAAALADLSPEIVVVARAGLGTLNHTELTVEAIRARGLTASGLVIGSWPAHPGLAERCNLEDLSRVTRLPLLAVVPDGVGRSAPDDFRAAAPGWFRT